MKKTKIAISSIGVSLILLLATLLIIHNKESNIQGIPTNSSTNNSVEVITTQAEQNSKINSNELLQEDTISTASNPPDGSTSTNNSLITDISEDILSTYTLITQEERATLLSGGTLDVDTHIRVDLDGDDNLDIISLEFTPSTTMEGRYDYQLMINDSITSNEHIILRDSIDTFKLMLYSPDGKRIAIGVLFYANSYYPSTDSYIYQNQIVYPIYHMGTPIGYNKTKDALAMQTIIYQLTWHSGTEYLQLTQLEDESYQLKPLSSSTYIQYTTYHPILGENPTITSTVALTAYKEVASSKPITIPAKSQFKMLGGYPEEGWFKVYEIESSTEYWLLIDGGIITQADGTIIYSPDAFLEIEPFN